MNPEPTAWRSNAAPWVMPSPACTDTALAGNVLSGVAVASTIRSIDGASTWDAASAAFGALLARAGEDSRRGHDQADRRRFHMGRRERGFRRLDGEVRGVLAGGRDAALANAGALGDPFVGGVDLAGELGIGEDMLGQVAPDAQNDRPRHAHDAAPAVRGAPCCRVPSMPLIF